MKQCRSCKELKALDQFGRNARNADSLQARCKSCMDEYYAKNMPRIQEGRTRRYAADKEKILAQNAAYYAKNRERINLRKAQYRMENADSIRARKADYDAEHRDHKREYNLRYYEANREGILSRLADKVTQEPQFTIARHGISLDIYNQLLAEQGGVCAICREPCATGRRLSIDHDHGCCSGSWSCGKCIRGLLCSRCNSGLGMFRDDLVRMNAAVTYLARTV